MIFKVFEKFGINLHQHCLADLEYFKKYELDLGDFDSLKYAGNIDWGCMDVICSGNLYSITGYLPSINFNGIKKMLITYTNTNVLSYGKNVNAIKIIDGKQITDENFDLVVTNIQHFLDKFDEQEIKIKQFLSTLNLDNFKNTVTTLSNEIKEKQLVLEDYKEKFYKHVKSQLSLTKDFQ